MPLADPTYVAACFLVLAAFCLGSALGFCLRRAKSSVWFQRSPLPEDHAGTRRCQYCRVGEALLLDEVIRVESGEMVETKCFVCAECGLPQWVVTRCKVMGPASR